MTSRRLLAVLTAALLLGAGANAQAATPFTAGSGGSTPDVAVSDSGAGHIVWTTPSPSTVGYCRVLPGGGSCERTATLSFPGGSAPNQRDASVFAPTGTNKVVVVAGCWNCGFGGGLTERVFRWDSADGGSSFTGPFEIQAAAGFKYSDGHGAWLDDANLFVGISGTALQAMPPGITGAVTHSGFGLNYGPEVARVPGANALVSATNDLDAISFNVYNGAGLTAVAINNPANWSGPQLLSGAEGDNDSSGVISGPSGLFLHYRRGMGGDAQVAVRRFDPVAKTFGAPQYIAGDSAVDHSSLAYPDATVDGAGRIHAVWRSLYDGGRLRYTVSDATGSTFSAPATLAGHEAILGPRVAADPAGHGFAVWSSTGGVLRAVALDPQAESSGGGGTLPGGSGTTTTTPGGTTTTTPTSPTPTPTPTPTTRRPSPQRTTTARVPGATVSFGVPRGCVVRGKTFTVTLRWKKQKRKGNKFVKVRRADFYIGTRRVKIDRKAPFRQRLRVTAKARKGSKITVRARAFIKVKRGKSPTKSIRATIRVCS